MEIAPELIWKIAPLYILVGLGILGGRLLGIGTAEVGKLLLYFFSPAVIFRGFYEADLAGGITWLPFLTFGLSCLMGWAGLNLARRRWRDGPHRIVAFSCGTGNTGFFGIPATLSLLGPEALPYVVMAVFGSIAFEVSYGYYIVVRSRAGIREAGRRVFLFPGLHAAWLGLLCNSQSIGLPVVALDTVDFLTQGYSTLGMMLVGLGLTSLNLRRLDISWIAYTFTAKFLVWPALAILAVMLDRMFFGLFDTLAHQVLIIQSLVPMAAMTAVHASVQQIHPEKASLAVALSTLLALVWLPFGLWVAGQLL